MRNSEHGRSMIEMLGVLAIVGILSVGGIAGYSKALNKQKINQLTYQINEIVINIRTLFMDQKNFEGLTVNTLLNSHVIPHDMIVGDINSSQTIQHAFNGEISIFPSVLENNEPKAFELYLNNITRDACVVIATLDWGQDIASGFLGLYIGTSPITAIQMADVVVGYPSKPNDGIYTPGQHEHAIPITIPEAMAACACSGATCNIGLKYM